MPKRKLVNTAPRPGRYKHTIQILLGLSLDDGIGQAHQWYCCVIPHPIVQGCGG